MRETGLWIGVIAAVAFAGCGGKGPVSSSGEVEEEVAAAPKLTVSQQKAGGMGNVRRPSGTGGDSVADEQVPDRRVSFPLWLEGEFAEDLNEDGTIDFDDFTLFVEKWGDRDHLVTDDGVVIDPLPPVVSARDYASLVDNLRAMGMAVEPAGEISQPFFTGAGRAISINGETVQVFEYETGEAAKREAGEVAPDGSSVGTTMVTWISQPHFFLADRVLVLYVGVDPAVLRALAETMGRPFAGGKVDPIPGPDDGVVIDPLPGDDGFVPTILLVAGSREEAAPLLSWLDDPDLAAQLEAFDYANNWLVAVIRGAMGTAGFGIDIEGVRYEDETVRIAVRLTDPARDELVAQVITYPHDIVAVSREDVPAEPGTRWLVLTTEGEPFARTIYPRVAVDIGKDSGAGSGGGPVVIIDGVPVDGFPDGAGQDDEEPAAIYKVDIRGLITGIDEGSGLAWEGEVIGSVRIEGQVDEDTFLDKAVVTVTAATRIVVLGEGEVHPATFADLTEGQRVQARFTGPVAESYPVQAVAAEIAILK